MTDVVILAGGRTPFGKFMGSLSKHSAVQLAAHVTKGALEKSQVSPKATPNKSTIIGFIFLY